MNTNLNLQVEAFVALRRALGYVVTSEEKLLKDFVHFVGIRPVSDPIRAQMAIDWARLPSPGRGPAGQASRLKVVRRFLFYLRASIPDTEIPEVGMLTRVRRPKPFLYSPLEIGQLIEAAAQLGPKGSLRPHTYVTLIGLIASTGLRVGEAIRLTVRDVLLQAEPAHLEVLRTKFRKSRLVRLHPTAADRLRAYAVQRKRLHYDGLSNALSCLKKALTSITISVGDLCHAHPPR